MPEEHGQNPHFVSYSELADILLQIETPECPKCGNSLLYEAEGTDANGSPVVGDSYRCPPCGAYYTRQQVL